MNGAQGYLTVNHGEDMLNAWHGGPTIAESEVALFFSMPGPDLVIPDGKTQPAFVNEGYSVEKDSLQGHKFRNWQMGALLKSIAGKAMAQ